MNNIIWSIKYKMGYQLKWAAWSLLSYVLIMFLLYYGLVKFSLINTGSGSFSYRLFVFVIVNFAWTMRFREDFNFLLTLSNTRSDIFKALTGVAFIFSAVFSVLIVLERLIVDRLNLIFQFNNINDPFHFLAPYATDHLLWQFAFFLMLSCCVSLVGLLLGSLFYRWGKRFTLFFWLFVAAIPTVFLPLLAWVLYHRGQLIQTITALGNFLRNFSLPVSAAFLLLLTIVFYLAAVLNIRKLPQQ